MVTIISYVATVLSIGGNVLLAKKSTLTFPVWILSNILWIVVNVMSSFNTAQVLMYVVYTGMNVYSYYNWLRMAKAEKIAN